MPKYTKMLQFDTDTRIAIHNRDRGCIFCKIQFQMEKATEFELEMRDCMHFIPKSALGLGIEQNGAEGCRYHHHMLDNGNQGARKEMLKIFEEYLKEQYTDWKKEDLVYRKCR